MNRLITALLLCLGLLLVTWRGGPASAQTATDKGQMYEDIEIMGRILDRVLKLPRHWTVAVNLPNYGGLNGGLGLGGLGLGGLGAGGGFGGMPTTGVNIYNPNVYPVPLQTMDGTYQTLLQSQLAAYGGGLGGFSGGGVQMVSVPVPAYRQAQGTYVKDHGIVFTITLPPPPSDPKPTAIPALPKAASEWDRVRHQLRGEKPEASASKLKPKEPSVADLVLEALAKNGHHFALGDKENLTVSIIFRREEQQVDGGQAVTASDPEANAPASGGEGGGANAGDKKNNNNPSPGAPAGEPSTPGDYELLGDLHLKQGQSKEALKAYQKAAEKDSDPKHAAAMYLKMAQIYLTAENNKTEADKVLDKAREFINRTQAGPAKKETPKTKKTESPLPSRLIITVSKELLDRAGRDQISLAEFKKAATVEYLPFASR